MLYKVLQWRLDLAELYIVPGTLQVKIHRLAKHSNTEPISKHSFLFQAIKIKMAAKPEKGRTTGSASNSEQFASDQDNFEEKQYGKGIAADNASDSNEPVYKTGWKLWAEVRTTSRGLARWF